MPAIPLNAHLRKIGTQASGASLRRAERLVAVTTTSVAIELDQPLVADPEVMRDFVEYDVSDLTA